MKHIYMDKLKDELKGIKADVLSHHPKSDVGILDKAFAYASRAHTGQKRKSGESYICLLYTSDAADE